MRTTTRVVIMGGSIASDILANLLATKKPDWEIVIIEQTALGEKPMHRVPQDKHTHVVSAGALLSLMKQFPDLEARLDAVGSPVVFWGGPSSNVKVLSQQGWYNLGDKEILRTRNVRRTTLESILRELANAHKNVTYISNVEVTGIHVSPITDQVIALDLRPRRGASAQETLIKGDIFFDASGQETSLFNWLDPEYLEGIETEVVNPFLGYTSCFYEKLDLGEPQIKMVGTVETPEQPWAGIITQLERNEGYLATIFGVGEDNHPPVDFEGFLNFTNKPGQPIHMLHEILKNGTPVSISGYTKCQSIRRKLWKAKKWPANLFVIGSALASFNPRYGQGISVTEQMARAAVEVILAGKPASSYFKKAEKIINLPWMFATMADFKHPATTVVNGKRPNAVLQAFASYADYLQSQMAYNSSITVAFVRVQHDVGSPLEIISPPLVMSYLSRNRR